MSGTPSSRGKKWEYQRQWAAQNPERIKAAQARYRSNRKRTMLNGAKNRAKRRGVPFALTIEDIQIPEFCPVLGIPLAHHVGETGFFPDSPSLDRIVPEKGYVRGNVRVISNRANRLKNDATAAELRAVLNYVENPDAG